MALNKITNADLNGKGVIGLPDTPQLSTSEMQNKFEETARDVIVPKFNELIDSLESVNGASNIGSNGGTIQDDLDTLNKKIQASTGDLSELIEELNEAKRDITTLEAEDVKINANVTAVTTRTSTLESENTTNKANISNNSSRIGLLENDNTNNKQNIATIQGTMTSLISDVADVKTAKHTHTNKSVLDDLTDNGGTLNYKGKPIEGGGGGNKNSYGHVKVGSVTLDAKDDDTFELVAGSNVTITPNAASKTIAISATGGGGGTSTGDMLKSDFVLPGGTGQVLSAKEADHATTATTATTATSATNATHATTADSATSATSATNATNATNATYAANATKVGSATTAVLEKLADDGGKLKYNGSLVNDTVVDSTLSKTSTNAIQNGAVATAVETINTKLSVLDTSGVAKDYVLTANGSGGTSWEEAKGGISEDDLYKEFSNLPTRTEDGYKFVEVTDNTKIMSAKATSEYSNKFVTRIIVPLPNGKDTIGVWQDKPSDEWETSPSVIENYMLVLPQLYEADDEELEISIKFDTTTSEPLVLGGWQYINQVVNSQGENCGAICIKCANTPTVDAKVIIDIERVRTETFNVQYTWG